jgi:hypothetical protein
MVDDTLEDMVMGAPAPGRECGDCIACCVVPAIDVPELHKPDGVVCPNCTGRGCAIHERRPAVCRDFYCAYLRIPSMPPESRPDKLGVMFTLERQLPPSIVFEHVYYVAVATGDPRALQSPMTQNVIRMLAQSVLPVFITYRGSETYVGRKILVHPEPALANAIMNPAPQKDRALVKQGREWLKRYAPLARLAGGEHTNLPYGL